MASATRSGWIYGAFGKALSISFSLPDTISKAISLHRAHEGLNDNQDNSPLDPLSDVGQSPQSSPLSSPPSSRPSSPLPPTLSTSAPDILSSTATALPPPAHKRRRRRKHPSVPKPPNEQDNTSKRKNRHSHENRRAKRARATAVDYDISSGLRTRVVESAAAPLRPEFSTDDMENGSNAYLGQRRSTPAKKGWGLEEVVGEQSRWNFDLVEWDATCTVPMVDSNDSVFGVLLETPKDPAWPELHRAAAEALEERRGRLKVDKSSKRHRRGHFVAQAVGYGYGGGQEEPKEAFHEPGNRAVFDELLALTCFIRFAGYASSAFAMWAPRLYSYYKETASSILHRFPIRPNFRSSIFAAATFNFGPRTVTFPHIDYLNYALGWCAITALGDYDYKRGGHLILWDLGLVIEFPPGSTILIPSAYLKHSNTSIHKHEQRYSFTQYTAGGLFRFMEDGGRTREAMTKEERRACEERERSKMSEGWNMYTKLSELSV